MKLFENLNLSKSFMILPWERGFRGFSGYELVSSWTACDRRYQGKIMKVWSAFTTWIFSCKLLISDLMILPSRGELAFTKTDFLKVPKVETGW